jgi:hypothetical protein
METLIENKKILFRASSIGSLMVEGRKTTLTDNQKELLNEYLERKNGKGKSLTEKQETVLNDLISRKNAPPELSDTAKRYIEQQWLLLEKGFYQELDNKYISKGLENEDEGIVLVSEIENSIYEKNEERKTIGNITGECDIKCTINGVKVIKDIKSSWSPMTFMNGDLSTLYEWQGRVYMYLYDADEFHLHYTLTDCPLHILENEKWKLRNKYGIIDDENPIMQRLFKQLEKNLIFSNGNYTKEERVKSFIIKRDIEKEQLLLSKIPLAVEYYKSIRLNQI